MIIVVYILTHRLDITCQRHRAVYCYATVVVTEGSSLGRRSPVAHRIMIVSRPSMPVERQCVIY